MSVIKGAAHYMQLSSLNICIDVTRACSGEIGQNLLTTHFLASPHVCDTIEGLILAYYE
jgi:hypothetical protein